MNKKTLIFFLIGGAFLLFVIYSLVKEFVNNKPESSNFKPSFKESNLGGDKVEYLDSLTLIYSNYKYGFSMDFPDHWTTDRGVSEHTIVRGVQIDSAISFAINVIELSDMKDADITLWTLWDDKGSAMQESYHNMLSQSVNSNIYNYTTRKVHVDNREAIEAKFNYAEKEVDLEFEIQSIVYSVYIMPNMFTIGLNVPKLLYDLNPDYYNPMINNLRLFIKPKK